MRAKHFLCVLTTPASSAKIWYHLNVFKPCPTPPEYSAAIRYKAVVLLLLIHCLMLIF